MLGESFGGNASDWGNFREFGPLELALLYMVEFRSFIACQCKAIAVYLFVATLVGILLQFIPFDLIIPPIFSSPRDSHVFPIS